jgi:GNAT superfamily N-acetyltransferase
VSPEAPRGWTLERISKTHDRAAFDSGVPALDEYLRRFARQNDRKDLGRTYVATPREGRTILGYFTIRAGAVAARELPEDERRGLPAYPVPVVHLARLAVDLSARGRGLGKWLLVHALRKAMLVADPLGVRAVEVLAKDTSARSFYERFGFRSLLDDPDHLYLSMAAIRGAFPRE